MRKEYSKLTETQKLRYWESLIAHKIRSQSETGDDPNASLDAEFFAHCKKKDPKFERFLPDLSRKFYALENYFIKYGKSVDRDYLKTGAFIFSLLLYFGIQIFMLFNYGLKVLIYILFFNGIMGGAYLSAYFSDRKKKQLYKTLADEKGLSFSYNKGGIPGLLYYPIIEGVYKGFSTKLILKSKWTGRWSGGGLIGMGTPQITTGSYLQMFLHSNLSKSQIEKIKKYLNSKNLKGDFFVEADNVCYKRIGAIGSKKMKNEFSLVYDILYDTVNNLR